MDDMSDKLCGLLPTFCVLNQVPGMRDHARAVSVVKSVHRRPELAEYAESRRKTEKQDKKSPRGNMKRAAHQHASTEPLINEDFCGRIVTPLQDGSHHLFLDKEKGIEDAQQTTILANLDTEKTLYVDSEPIEHYWNTISALSESAGRSPSVDSLQDTTSITFGDERLIFPSKSSYTIDSSVVSTQEKTFQDAGEDLQKRQDFNVDIVKEGVNEGGVLTHGPTPALCIFQTQSLVCLNFRHCRLEYDLPADPDVVIYLPNLKKLGLSLTASQCRFVSKLLKSCLLLEDLSLGAAERRHGLIVFDDADTGALIAISSGILKRLELVMSFMKVKVLIDTPKLESFSLFGIKVDCCFVQKPIALSDATIITVFPAVVAPLMTVLLDVRVLHILGVAFKMFEGLKDDKGNLLIFRNLDELNLQLSTGKLDELKTFPLNSRSSCLLPHFKRINVVSSAKHGLHLKKLAHYFLRNAPALERLSFVVRSQTSQSEDGVKSRLDEMVFCMDLYSCLGNSPGCLIEFQGQYAKVPTNNAELQEMQNLVQLLRESLAVRTS